MAKIVGNSVISAYELWRGRQRPMVTFNEDDDTLVRAPVPLHISTLHWWGYYLNMAPRVSCVVVHPNGFAEPHLNGGMKAFTPGRYQLFYVDMSDQTSLLSDVEAYTKDAWRVRLTLDMVWAVRDPLRVWKMSDPHGMLVERCMAAVANYIQSMPYERLIALPEPDQEPDSDEKIVTDILDRLRNNRALNGFRFVNLSILNRQGDPERTQIIKQAMNKLEETRRDQEVKVEEAKRDKVVAEERKLTAEAQNELQLTIARGNLNRDKEMAKYTAEIYKILQETQEQWIKLEQMKQSQQLNQQRIIRAWEVTGDAMAKIATILGQAQTSPGAQHLLNEHVAETLMQIMKQMASMLPPQNVMFEDSDEDRRVLPAVTINRSRS